ncbi:hypothetical protein MUG91_G122n21 [Manis pentadactyla]|nr:hypothetical protein MUG91_G122n21 [Manis pentadactyla]
MGALERSRDNPLRRSLICQPSWQQLPGDALGMLVTRPKAPTEASRPAECTHTWTHVILQKKRLGVLGFLFNKLSAIALDAKEEDGVSPEVELPERKTQSSRCICMIA